MHCLRRGWADLEKGIGEFVPELLQTGDDEEEELDRVR
jgi:hypothetical protein